MPGCLTYIALFATFFLETSGLDTGSVTGLTFDAAAAKNRPVSKVITLLKDMLKQLEKEAEEDEAIYNKLACWCSQNDKEKTEAVKDAQDRIADLTARARQLGASGARLGVEITGLEKEKDEDVNALDQATGIRNKQYGQYNLEEKELTASIAAIKAALIVLSKHHGDALLQLPRSHVLSIATTLQHELEHHAAFLQGVLTPSQKKTAMAFVQAPEDYFDASPTFKQSYAPQSGEIYGILKQMLETFQYDLDKAQKEEGENQRSFTDLSDAKTDEIKAETDQVDAKDGQLANVDDKRANILEDLDDTKRSLEADQDFLLMLKEKCALIDKEWEERQRVRQLEMEAVSKAIAILSGDDAHDLFTRTFNPSFLQKESDAQVKQREQASRVVAKVAKKLDKPELATLAYRIKLDAFTKVKKAIDDMVAQLMKEKEDEAKHKDFCVDEFGKNQLETEKKEREKETLTGKVEDLQMTIKQLTGAIASLQAQIKEMQVQMKRAGEDREQENKEFQATVADQRETEQLLKSALGVLQDFYGKRGVSLRQKQPPMPQSWDAYKKQEGSSSVMSLLSQIISDAKSMAAEAIKSEEDAQKTYEVFVKETNGAIEAKSEEIVNKSEEKATAESDLVTTKEAKDSTMLALEQLSNYNAELHQSCDFVLKNFEVRQTARDEEIEALKQAKAILSGAKFQTFLQR